MQKNGLKKINFIKQSFFRTPYVSFCAASASLSDSEDAISPIIGTVLILAIMVSITGTMLAWGIPQIQESEAYAIYTSAQNNFLNFDADLDQVIIQGEGSSRSSTVSFSAGTFVHRENLDEIRYYYETTTWSSFEILGIKMRQPLCHYR